VTHKQEVTLAAGQPYHGNITGGSYALVIIAPIGPSGIAFLGDEGKIASTGKQRVVDIHESGDNLDVTLASAPGEVVTLHGIADNAPGCFIADGKPLPVQYDPVTRHFSVVIHMPPTGGQQLVSFRRQSTK
jgi:hypothetical protein